MRVQGTFGAGGAGGEGRAEGVLFRGSASLVVRKMDRGVSHA